jgi:hypothetical protein
VSEEATHGFGGVAAFDQRQAEAIKRLRKNRHGFVLFTIEEADDAKLRMKYVGSMDDRLAMPFLATIVETCVEAAEHHNQPEEDE